MGSLSLTQSTLPELAFVPAGGWLRVLSTTVAGV